MSKTEEAVSKFNEGYNCSESVVSVYADAFGIGHDTAVKLASGLGAGLGRMGHVCGAVNGACIVLGLKYGRTSPGDNEARDKVYSLVREFADRFKKEKSSILCSELLGCDIGTAEGMETARDNSLFKTVCPDCVRTAVGILEDMIK